MDGRQVLEAIIDTLEMQAFVFYHNYSIHCGDQWLYKYKFYLLVRRALRKKDDALAADLPSLPDEIWKIAREIIGGLKMYDVMMDEEGRKNSQMYEDNMTRWAIESMFSRQKESYKKEYDENQELQYGYLIDLGAIVEHALDRPEEVAERVTVFWGRENLDALAAQANGNPNYSLDMWRTEKHRL